MKHAARSLFEDDDAPSNRTSVTISGGAGRPLSKAQARFNALIEQIGKKRERLAAWDAVIPRYQRRRVDELTPLVEEALDLQIEMVHCLDRAAAGKGLTATERRKITRVISGLAGDLLAVRDDPALKAVYNKHSRSDYDAEEADGKAHLKDVLEDMLGVELDDDLDIHSPEAVFEQVRKQIDGQIEEDDATGARSRARRQSATQQRAEARREAEAQRLRQSIRDVYRKLARAVHPDRETDPEERQRKTALMQRANQAYDRNDLLQLLELQLELEHIDQADVDNIGDDRLKHYNKILSEQLAELKEETLRVEAEFRARFGIWPLADVSPATVMRDLDGEIVKAERSIDEIRNDLCAFKDLKAIKAWLRTLRHRH